MKKIIASTAIIAFALMLGGNAVAAKPWSFAGIQLGAPLANSNLPSCPLPKTTADAWNPTALCITSISKKSNDGTQFADLGGLTTLHWPEIYASYIMVWNDRVATVRIHIGQVAFDTVKQILATRYGKPSSVIQEKITSNAGAVVPSTKITWHENGNTIVFSERCERVDRSCVDVANDAVMVERAHAQKQSAASDASIL